MPKKKAKHARRGPWQPKPEHRRPPTNSGKWRSVLPEKMSKFICRKCGRVIQVRASQVTLRFAEGKGFHCFHCDHPMQLVGKH